MNKGWTRRLRPLLRARHFDEVLMEHADLLVDHYHVSIGQEGTAVGISLHRTASDPFLVNYRNHAHLVANGSDVHKLYAELFSRDLGHQHGRSGSFHLSDPGLGFPHTSALVAGAVPLACGVAWARKKSGKGGVVFTNFGEGALGEGVIHECFNIAKLWELPIVFVCESNQIAVDGQANPSQSASNLVDIPAAHRIPASYVDASNPIEADAALGELVAEVRAGNGPRFLHAQSCPWPGNDSLFPKNVTGNVDLNRSMQPRDGWEAGDPILNEVKHQVDGGIDFDEIAALSDSIRLEMLGAVQVALACPLAAPEVARRDVWASPPESEPGPDPEDEG
jgi:TPP-dependent pyruvate/acetoin dehydrogenase alpha subunit